MLKRYRRHRVQAFTETAERAAVVFDPLRAGKYRHGRQAAEGKEIPRDKLHRREDAQMFKQINQARICKIVGGNTKVLRWYPTTCLNYACHLALHK